MLTNPAADRRSAAECAGNVDGEPDGVGIVEDDHLRYRPTSGQDAEGAEGPSDHPLQIKAGPMGAVTHVLWFLKLRSGFSVAATEAAASGMVTVLRKCGGCVSLVCFCYL